MTQFFKSFYFKISLVFIALLILLSGLQLAVSYYFANQYQRARLQRLNWQVASHYAAEILKDVAQKRDLEEILISFHLMNPSMDFYILNHEGVILEHSQRLAPVSKSIPIEPIESFIENAPNPPSSLMSQDPVSKSSSKIFSAAELNFQGRKGYLLVIMQGKEKERIGRLLLDTYLFQLGSTSIVLVISFTVLLGLLLISILTRRLRAMTDVVELFELGRLNERINVTSDDELGRLAKTFNRMAEQMAEFISSLQETDRLRRELIRNVSHDLRTPLTLMKGNLETLLLNRNLLQADELEQYLEIVHANTQSLEHLVEDLFELSKLEARERVPSREEFPIQELISDVFQKFRDRADRQRVSLALKVSRELPPVLADVALIERVLTNLVENALAYTQSGGEIVIEAREKTEKVWVRVSDNGSGIPKDELPHIFEAYFRGRRVSSSGQSGTGLGLAIVRRIVELHGGWITAESIAGEGTTFEFCLLPANDSLTRT